MEPYAAVEVLVEDNIHSAMQGMLWAYGSLCVRTADWREVRRCLELALNRELRVGQDARCAGSKPPGAGDRVSRGLTPTGVR